MSLAPRGCEEEKRRRGCFKKSLRDQQHGQQPATVPKDFKQWHVLLERRKLQHSACWATQKELQELRHIFLALDYITFLNHRVFGDWEWVPRAVGKHRAHMHFLFCLEENLSSSPRRQRLDLKLNAKHRSLAQTTCMCFSKPESLKKSLVMWESWTGFTWIWGFGRIQQSSQTHGRWAAEFCVSEDATWNTHSLRHNFASNPKSSSTHC